MSEVQVHMMLPEGNLSSYLSSDPLTIGSDPRCHIHVIGSKAVDPLAGLIWNAEFGVVILCVGESRPLVFQQDNGDDTPIEIIAPRTARLFHDDVSFNIAGLTGYVMVSDNARDEFRNASQNIRTNIAFGRIDTHRPIRFRDSIFDGLCYPIMPIDLGINKESSRVDDYHTEYTKNSTANETNRY